MSVEEIRIRCAELALALLLGEIVGALRRQVKREDLADSRDLLLDLVRVHQEETGGRPSEVWSLR